jgi:cytochrome P450
MSTATEVDSDAEISTFFAADPQAIAWPYPMYQRWQQGAGIVRWQGGPATIFTRYDDVKAVMSGAYPIANNAYRHGALAESTMKRLPQLQHEIFMKVLDFESLFMSRNDGAEHARLRRIAARAFTARRIEQLRNSIQRHLDELIVEMQARPEPDFKRDVADKLPVRVIVDLIGVPQADRDMIWEWSEAIAAHFSLDRDTLRRVDDAIDAFRDYVGAMVEKIRRTGEGPELAKLLLEQRDNEAMTEDELVAMYLLILFGGSETTTNLLGNGFYALQRHRDQWDALVRDPSLVRGALDELMRYDSPHHYLPRVVVEDFEIKGEQLHAGDSIIIMMGAANRDPDHFPDPERLDITRDNKGDHLSLAFGVHYCLGAALARLEGEVVFTTLVSRFPQARLLTEDVSYRGSAMLRAIEHLPVDLGAPS